MSLANSTLLNQLEKQEQVFKQLYSNISVYLPAIKNLIKIFTSGWGRSPP
jgi:hypothetical protein